jgi:hypothetical protein
LTVDRDTQIFAVALALNDDLAHQMPDDRVGVCVQALRWTSLGDSIYLRLITGEYSLRIALEAPHAPCARETDFIATAYSTTCPNVVRDRILVEP